MKKLIISISLFIFMFSCGVMATTSVALSSEKIAENSNTGEVPESSEVDSEKGEIVQTAAAAKKSNETAEDLAKSVNSRAAVVIDRASHKVLFEKNAYSKVKMASTTKIMTAIVVLENCKLDEIATVSAKAAGTGGSRIGLKTGDKISVNDLLYGLLLFSGNDTAVVLAEHVGESIDGFADMMNKKAAELGLTNTCFKTPHGLDKEGHFTTAYELAILSDYALKNETFAKIVGTKNATIHINGTPKNIKNTNELLGNLEGVYGIKTGFTNGANRCLVTACKRNNLDIISVALGADTKKFRTSDSIKMIEYSFANFEPVNISEIVREKFEAWKRVNANSFNVYKPSEESDEISIALEETDDYIIPIEKSKKEKIQCKINCETNLIPPMERGTILGGVEVYTGDELIYNKEILLDSNIYKKRFLEYIKKCLEVYCS